MTMTHHNIIPRDSEQPLRLLLRPCRTRGRSRPGLHESRCGSRGGTSNALRGITTTNDFAPQVWPIICLCLCLCNSGSCSKWTTESTCQLNSQKFGRLQADFHDSEFGHKHRQTPKHLQTQGKRRYNLTRHLVREHAGSLQPFRQRGLRAISVTLTRGKHCSDCPVANLLCCLCCCATACQVSN